MTFTLVASICVALVGAVVMMSIWRLPVRAHCPDCGRRTTAVLAPRWMRWLGLPVHARWCMSCGWEGLSRRGKGRGVLRAGEAASGIRRRTDRASSRNGSGGAPWRREGRREEGRAGSADAPHEGDRSGTVDGGERD